MTRFAWVAAVGLGCGCGSSAPPPPQPAAQPIATGSAGAQVLTSALPAQPSAALVPGTTLTVDAVCDHMLALEAEQCGNFGTKIDLNRESCTSYMSNTLPPHDMKTRDEFTHCVVDPGGCKGALACFEKLTDDGVDAQDLRECADRASTRAVGVTADDYATHNGSSYTHYSQVVSSREAPIERCTMQDEGHWLGTLTCADGSHPIKDAWEAEHARVGNVGPGGRCGSIVDHYRVPCPEGATDIFIDAYVCPRP